MKKNIDRKVKAGKMDIKVTETNISYNIKWEERSLKGWKVFDEVCVEASSTIFTRINTFKQ